MKKSVLVCAVVLAMSLLTACQSFGRRDAGTVGGAVVGGLAGNAITGGSALGTVAGAAGGAYVGNQLAR